MLGNLTGWHALIVLAVLLLLFGATKLPALARGVGQSMKIFRKEISDGTEPGEADAKADAGADATSRSVASDRAAASTTG
jgi:sec-independent protein translocase protein TatA